MNFPADISDTERALTVIAYAVMRHGDAYVPLLDRLEQEFEAEQRRGTGHRDRASAILRSLARGVRNAPAA